MKLHPLMESLRWVAAAGAWEINYRTGKQYYSDQLRRVLGEPLDRESDATDPIERVHPDDRGRLDEVLQTAVERHNPQVEEVEFRLKARDGTYRWIHSQARIIEWLDNGQPARIVGWHTDITDRKRIEDAIAATTRNVERLTGEAFFQSLARALAEALGVRYSLIGRLIPEGRVETVGFCQDGVIAKNIVYPLRGSPCEHTGRGELCYFPDKVADLFPTDESLRVMGVESYMGVGLTALDGSSVGLMAVLDGKPLEREHLAKILLPLFAARASVEIERLASEERRQASQKQYRLLFEHLISACALLEPVRDENGAVIDFRYLEVNPAFEAMTQIKAEGIQGHTMREMVPGVEDYWIDGMAKVADTGAPTQFEEYSANYNKWYELRGFRPEKDRVAIIFNDVTERRRVETSLRESERTLRELFDNTSLAGFVTGLDGIALYCNEAALSLLGRTQEEVIGKRWPERFISQEEHNEILEALKNINGDWARLPRHWRNHVLHSSGTRRLVEWDVSPVYDQAGRLVSIACLGRDLSLWEELEEQYRQSLKMEAIGRLAGGIAHDFNNLLTVINGYSSLALTRLGANDAARTAIVEIQKAGERAAELTRQLLAFSRKQILQTRPLSFNDVVTDAMGMLSRLIGAHINLESQLAPDLGAVRADPIQMMQVVMNLAVNARDAIAGTGHITLRTFNVRVNADGDPAFPSAPPGDYACLMVADDGGGMDEETQRHMFEPFFTTKPQGQGTGLGLATVYGIVRQSSGYIAVQSRVGEGTAIRVLMPQVLGCQPALEEKPSQVRLLAHESVLLVEDQDAVREFLHTILEESGYAVVTAPNGEAALTMIRAGLMPELLISDIVMPGMNGQALAVQARDLVANLKVILISGYAPTHEKAACDAYLQKPFNGDTLLGAVRSVLSRNSKK